jgi:hypothetical protein
MHAQPLSETELKGKWLAWSMWAASMMLFVAEMVLTGLYMSGPSTDSSGSPAADLLIILVLLCTVTVGALVASRQPSNSIGWIFCVVGLTWNLGSFAGSYATVALSTSPAPLPGGALMAWVDNWTLGPSLYSVLILLFLLFPTGKPLTPRWRSLVWVTVATGVLLLLADMFSPGPFIRDFTQVENPLGVPILEGSREFIENPVLLCQIALLILSVISLVLRFRRSKGDERQQIKWFALGGVFVGAVFAVAPLLWSTPGLGDLLWPILFALALASIPLTVGIAILKYRLYDIDIIIRRTLIYGALTSVLALLYFGSVIALETLLRPLTGQGHNDLVVVASTLLIAALFTPLRTRIQRFIDRRFYRRKYDVARTLEAFSTALRDEVDLDALAGRLVEVVDETMQPAHVSVWLSLPDEEAK